MADPYSRAVYSFGGGDVRCAWAVEIVGPNVVENSSRRGRLQRQPDHGRGGQESTQVRVWPNLAGNLGAEQSVAHSRRRLWLQSVSWRRRICVVSIRSFGGDLLGNFGAMDALSETAGTLWV